MNLRNFFEYNAESVYGMVEGAMGEANAARFFPLIGALWMFILFGNLFALIPGFVSPNDTLKTNVGLAVMVFVLTHYYGVKEHGLAYFKHFLGPSLALAPLMLPIELISHFARPMSLAVRLMGNMMADHKVVMSFFALVPLLVPLPFGAARLQAGLLEGLKFATFGMLPEEFLLTRDQVALLEHDNVVSEAAQAEGRTLQGIGIAPESIEAIVPSYLYRFRRAGQFDASKFA